VTDLERPSGGGQYRVVRYKRLAAEAGQERLAQQQHAAAHRNHQGEAPELAAPAPLDQVGDLARPYRQRTGYIELAGPQEGVELTQPVEAIGRGQLQQAADARRLAGGEAVDRRGGLAWDSPAIRLSVRPPSTETMDGSWMPPAAPQILIAPAPISMPRVALRSSLDLVMFILRNGS
jgi:hypothetical protein